MENKTTTLFNLAPHLEEKIDQVLKKYINDNQESHINNFRKLSESSIMNPDSKKDKQNESI